MGARLLLVAALLAAAPAPAIAAASARVAYDVGPASEVAYDVVHPMHKVHGVSHALAGRLVLVDGRLAMPVTLRLPLITFDSGNANRDSNAATTLDVGRFPAATLEVERFEETSRTQAGAATKIAGKATGKLALRGVTRALTVPLTATVRPDVVEAEAAFAVSLEAYGVPRPSLLFRPIDDEVRLAVKLVAPRAR